MSMLNYTGIVEKAALCSGLMSNLIKKSWAVSKHHDVAVLVSDCFGFGKKHFGSDTNTEIELIYLIKRLTLISDISTKSTCSCENISNRFFNR